MALATYVAARLAHDIVVDRGLSQAARVERAAHAKHWLSTLALPAALRPAFISSVDASAGERGAAARAVKSVIVAAAGFLDPAACEELAQLVAALESHVESSDAQPVVK